MKKIICILSAAFALVSCGQNEPFDNVTPDIYIGESVEVAVSFSDMEIEIKTRGFLDDVAVTEPWESKIVNLAIYVFDDNGNFILSKTVNSTDLAAKYTILQIPREATGKTCSFYAVANSAGGTWAQDGEDYFRNNSICSVNPRNFIGKVNDLLSGQMFDQLGFPMSGYKQSHVEQYGYLTEVHIPLKRLMAKIALEWRVDPDFSANHNGAVLIMDKTDIYCGLNSDYCYTFEADEVRNYGSYNIWYNQNAIESYGWNQNLWYVYENKKGFSGNSTASEKIIELKGIYDNDGDLSTTDDQYAVYYSIPVDYITGEGIVSRNTVYRISATIKGVGQNNLSASWQALDWVTLRVNDLDVGN